MSVLACGFKERTQHICVCVDCLSSRRADAAHTPSLLRFFFGQGWRVSGIDGTKIQPGPENIYIYPSFRADSSTRMTYSCFLIPQTLPACASIALIQDSSETHRLFHCRCCSQRKKTHEHVERNISKHAARSGCIWGILYWRQKTFNIDGAILSLTEQKASVVGVVDFANGELVDIFLSGTNCAAEPENIYDVF
jgi:hypothetical protein